MDITTKAMHKLYKDSDVSSCLAVYEKELKALPPTRFHDALDLTFTNSKVKTAMAINEFINDNQLKAVYIEFCDDNWDSCIFGWEEIDLKSYEYYDKWLGDFTCDMGLEPLQGMESLKNYDPKRYWNYLRRDEEDLRPTMYLSQEIIFLKFAGFIDESLKMLPSLNIPVFVGNHDEDPSVIFGKRPET